MNGSRIYFCSEGSGYNYFLAKPSPTELPASLKITPTLYPMKYENAFYVIKYTEAPSVLLETLFVSNQSDAEKLLDEEWLAAEAQGIAAGIKAFLSDG